MVQAKDKTTKAEFVILHGKSGYYYIPYHVNHSAKNNHKLHISATIEDDDEDFDIMFHVLNEEQFMASIPDMLQDAQGNNEANFQVDYLGKKSKKPKLNIDIKETKTLFILFDNRYSWASDKTISAKIHEEWDELEEKDEKNKNSVFVIMPIGDSEMDEAYRTIKSECRKMGLKASRVDEFAGSHSISDDIIEQIKKSEFIIVDLTHERPNVYYELGYAHGEGNKGNNILLIAKKGTKVHFDISGLRVRFYDSITDLHEIIYDDLEMMIQKR